MDVVTDVCLQPVNSAHRAAGFPLSPRVDQLSTRRGNHDVFDPPSVTSELYFFIIIRNIFYFLFVLGAYTQQRGEARKGWVKLGFLGD